jgi:nicotinamidase-related amidase
MSDSSTTRYSERLTRDNAAVLFVDHQIGLYSGVRDIPLAELKHNVTALAKAAQILGLPLIVTTTTTTTTADSMWGPLIPELAAVLPADLKVIDRSTVNDYTDLRSVRTARVQRIARDWGELWHCEGLFRSVRNALLTDRDPYDYQHIDWLYGT